LWLIVKSLHQLRCSPLFVAVADHLPPPDALLLRRRCLHCHAVPPLPSSLHRRFCLLRRAAVTFFIAPLLIVAPPLPLSSRRRSLRRHAIVSAFLVVPPVLPLSTRCRCLRHCAAAPFVVAPPFLPLSSRRRCLHRRAAVSAFVVGPPVLPKGCLC
jgi:hypothetical protein